MKGKKLLAGILSAAMVLGTMAFPVFANDNIIEISNVDDIKKFSEDSKTTNFSGKTIVLTDDIDMSSVTEWYPIGIVWANRFAGTFDGQGHTISNFTSTKNGYSEGGYNNGFFGTLSGATIKNITFDNATVECATSYNYGNVFGIVAAYSYGNNDTFENITVKNSSVKGFGKIGGIVGMAAEPSATTIVKNCSVEDTTISATYDGGGIIGLVLGKADMSGNTVSNITYKKDPSYTYKELDTEVICDGSAASCPGNGTVVRGLYMDDGSYYWGGYADFYIQYGNSAHDCSLKGESLMVANSEIVHNAVAEINGKKYLTLAEAIQAAQDGDTVTLLCDIDDLEADRAAAADNAEYRYDLTGITLDLGGHTYTHYNYAHIFKGNGATIKNGKIVSKAHENSATDMQNGYGSYALSIGWEDDAKTVGFTAEDLTLIGGVSVHNATNVILKNVNVAGQAYYAVWSEVGSDVTIESGTYSSKGYATLGSSNNGVINVNGGDFTDANGTMVLADSDVVISGGTFSTDVSEFCEDGFTAEKDETTGQYVIKKALAWETDTDSGYYMDSDTKYGMMRFMFKTAPTGTVIGSGIKYINATDISKSVTAMTTKGATTFQGDVVKVPFNTTGTYYARAYITTDEETFWSEPVGCAVNWNQFFTDYTGGAQ